jgi:hypothetical protein
VIAERSNPRPQQSETAAIRDCSSLGFKLTIAPNMPTACHTANPRLRIGLMEPGLPTTWLLAA